jgi:Zn-dependent protease with chaperone function
MSREWQNQRKADEPVAVSSRVRYFLTILLLLSHLFPAILSAQPFDLSRSRRSVVRVIGDRGNSIGSGSIIKVEGKEGYVLTAYHVIERDVENEVSQVQVELFTEERLEAHISRRRVDTTNDIAVLTVRNLPSPPPPEIPWGSSVALRETQRVYALGHPRGGPDWAITEGTVSSLEGGKIYFSGTAVSPGNSGGPLLNEQGALVGMNLRLGEGLGNALMGEVIRVIIQKWVKGLPEPGPAEAREGGTAPSTGRGQPLLVSEAQEEAMSVEAYRQMLRKEPVTRDPRATEPVQRVVRRLEMATDPVDFRWEVNVIKNDKIANAFALPGGKIVVYTGLFPSAQTEAGLAIILGHELGHVMARHGAERMSQRLLAQLGGTALAAAVQSSPQANMIMAAYGLGAQVGVPLPYSQQHESEADRIGLVLAAKAGYNPRVAIDVWKRMARLPGGRPAEFLATHPNPETRIVDIQGLLPQAMAQFRSHPDAGETPLPPLQQISGAR